MLDREQFRVDLRRRLHGIAAVNEHRRTHRQHHGRSRRTGEAGEPGQPFLARRQAFVLLAVGARHDETVKASALELGAQALEPRRCGGSLVRIVE